MELISTQRMSYESWLHTWNLEDDDDFSSSDDESNTKEGEERSATLKDLRRVQRRECSHEDEINGQCCAICLSRFKKRERRRRTTMGTNNAREFKGVFAWRSCRANTSTTKSASRVGSLEADGVRRVGRVYERRRRKQERKRRMEAKRGCYRDQTTTTTKMTTTTTRALRVDGSWSASPSVGCERWKRGRASEGRGR